MKKLLIVGIAALIIVCALLIAACQPAGLYSATERDRLFNEGWKFIRDSLPYRQTDLSAEQPEYDDSAWQVVDLPHDWSIQSLPGEENEEQIGPFSKSSPGAASTGHVMGGTGWYRKHFTLKKRDAGKTALIRFDGVYMETDVWVNGKPAGRHVYGYTPFWFNITSLLNNPGEDNVIAVRVCNTGRNSRWYSGSGIYRNVHLTLVNPVHVAVWGVQITTPEISGEEASVSLGITARNDGSEPVEALVTARVKGPDNQLAGETSQTVLLPPRENSELQLRVTVNTPSLWSPGNPSLYQAEITLSVKGKTTDQMLQSFGIRSLEVSAEKGFMLNGEPLELKGGCLHHDNGLLGAAAFERAEERRVEIMKANGFSAIRTSHNPPSEAFLNACDRLGMLVIDETFDMWERPKNPHDYHRFFRDWWKSDVEAMILRDRNHPSIICWSIGNEVNERADTSGLRIARNLIAHIQQLDTTRPFTNAICEFWDMPGRPWEATAPAFALLTIGGYNYQYLRYEEDHAKYPDRVMMGTESVPMDAFGNWQMVEKHPWVIGDFVWTGMDYLGESGIGHTQYLEPGQPDAFAMPWPWFNAWCGDIDILGNKKPQMLYRDVLWGNSPLEINVHAPIPAGKTEKISYWGWYDEWPSWDWQGHEDKMLRVSAYTQGTSVRLELNGRVIGEKEVSAATRYTAAFDVPYEPGELRAVALEGDRQLAVKVLRTAGAPEAIRLTADRSILRADRNDLAFITIEVVDEFGHLVTDASREIKITVSGSGELIGAGNACPYDMKSFGKPVLTTFRGKAMVIVRPYSKAGIITITAMGEGLTEAIIDVRTGR